MRVFLLALLFITFFTRLKAEHLAGGEIFYECLGNNNFRITLYHYRDCNPGSLTPDNDDPDALIFVYDLDNPTSSGLRTFQFFKSSAVVIPNNDLGPCLQNPDPVCINRATYSGIINLPRNTRGYRIINQRCCRNNGIISLTSPSTVGSTYELFISGLATIDCFPSNASFSFSFDGFPPTQLCNQIEITTDQSASISNADRVTYQLCSPYNGANIDDPFPFFPYPYRNVSFVNGFGPDDPMGVASLTSLSTTTGVLRVNPSRQGRYVIGVCADAYKGGNLYASLRRDFQFNVFSCTGAIARTDQSSYISCDDYKVNFRSTSSGAQNLIWDFDTRNPGIFTSNQSNPTFEYPDTGKYAVSLTINAGLPCSSSVTVPVKVYPVHSVDFEFTNACLNDSIKLKDLSASTFNDIINSSWTFGDGTSSSKKNPGKKYNQAGSYLVSLTSETVKGCKSTVQKQVEAFRLPEVQFNVSDMCINSNQTVENTTAATEQVSRFDWTLNGQFLSNQVNPVLNFSSPGDKTLTLSGTNNLNCINTISKQFKVLENIKADFISTTSDICNNKDVFFESTSNGEITSYIWNFGNGLISQDANPKTTYAQPGNYWVSLKIENSTCPPDEITKTITVKRTPDVNLGGDREICGDNEEIITFDNPENYSLLWSTGDEGSTTSVPGNIGSLGLTAELEGCTTYAEINIYNRCTVYIPNAFAPGGVNKRFNIISKNVQSFELTIYNRWGDILFKTSDFNNGWDGTYKGESMPMGNYGYMAEVIDDAGEKQTKRGFFTLIR